MQKDSLKHDVAVFTGFKPALEACYLDWDEYILPGITYTVGSNPMYHCPFTCFRHAGDTRTEVNQVSIVGHFSNKLSLTSAMSRDSTNSFLQVNSSSAVLNYQPPISHHHSRRPLHVGLVEFSYLDRRRLNPREFSMCSRSAGGGGDGNRSSVSSEGFCENDTDIPDITETQVVLVSQGCAQLNNCGDTDSQVIYFSHVVNSSFVMNVNVVAYVTLRLRFPSNHVAHCFRREVVASRLLTATSA